MAEAKYLMQDDSVQDHLDPGDEKNLKGIIITTTLTGKDRDEWLKNRKIVPEIILPKDYESKICSLPIDSVKSLRDGDLYIEDNND